MIRTYDSNNKIRVSYAYDSFYSQRYYLLTGPNKVQIFKYFKAKDFIVHPQLRGRRTYVVKSRLQMRQFPFAGEFGGICHQVLPLDLADGERSDFVELLRLVIAQ